jgi:hypothetical protein
VYGLHCHRLDGDLPLTAGPEGNLAQLPISGSRLPKPMTGTLKLTFFSFFLSAYSLVMMDWLLPP